MSKVIYKDKIYNIDNSIAKKTLLNNDIHRVAVVMHRTPNLLALLYECFINNITYIPIDPSFPKERIKQIIDDSQPDCIITDSGIEFLKTSERTNIAYIIYTSGSTGVPKGVEITAESVNSFIDAFSNVVDFAKGKTIACLTTVSFDIFFVESIMALLKGLNVVLASDEEANNPRLTSALIERNSVDIVQMTPSRMQMLINYDGKLSCLSGVKDVLLGGEIFPLSLLNELQKSTDAKIYNLYGPTEATIWVTIADLTNKEKVDIGKPLDNAEIYIVDEKLHVLPIGEIGEICIAGKCLAKGYHNCLELTEAKFINLPGRTNTKGYRTGDMGRYLPDGNLEYKGRIDNQVKFRGHRIELEEIEVHFCRIPGVKQAIATVIELEPNDHKLAIYYTSKIDIDEDEIKKYLLTKIPKHYIPSIYRRVETFLYTDNGKIDRKRISEYPVIKKKNSKNSNTLSVLEREIYDFIIKSSEGKIDENTNINSDLVSLGFDSISFVKLIVKLEEQFGFEFETERLLIHAFTSVMSMIEYIKLNVF